MIGVSEKISRGLIGLLFSLVACTAIADSETTAGSQKPIHVQLTTELGNITLELYPDKAPKTVENFVYYVNDYYYDGVIFHRVVRGFVIQSGGYGFDLYPREPEEPVVNESNNGLLNLEGTVAMARLPDPDSARAQFFINLNNNPSLDPTKNKAGYTVFGRVVEGMDVVNNIGKARVRRVADQFKHLPREPILILKARVVKPEVETQ